MLEQPPSPATILEQSGTLAVKADNSSLAQILQQLSSKTGMQLEGLSGDERVFGTFGPGNPRDVIASLLNGTSYNIVMIGDLANGAPRELLLTPRNGAAAPTTAPANANQPPPAPNADDDNAGDDQPPDQPDQDVRPGEIVIEREPEQPGQPTGPRTPEQMLQQMQQLRNAQQTPPPADAQPQ